MHNSVRNEDEDAQEPDEGPAQAPIPSTDSADQRIAPRHTLLIRAAKLILGEAEYLCILRDVSETGASLRLFHDVPASAEMLLELQNQDRHKVELVWRDGERMGLRFLEPVDIHRLIEMPAPFDRRPIRVRLNVPGLVCVGEDMTTCTLRDLSQSGAKIACTRSFAIDQRVRLTATGVPTVQARIRWRRDDHLGLTFENTFQLGELASIVAHLQRGSAATARQSANRAG